MNDVTDLLRRLGRARRLGAVATLAWLAGMAAWAWLAPIGDAAVAPGTFKVVGERHLVNHRDGGIVAEVHVRDGQRVQAGELLLTLADARVDSSASLLEAQLDAERLRESRLAAESRLEPGWPPSRAAGAQAAGGRASDAVQREAALFAARRAALQAQVSAVRSQLADVAAEIVAHQRALESLGQALALAREESRANERLLQDNFINRTRLTTLQRTVAEYEAREQSVAADLAQARQLQADLNGRLATVRQTFMQQAAEELRDATARVIDLQARSAAALDTAGRQRVVAPVAGRLVGLRVQSRGATIGPREPIVEILPDEAVLVAEVRLSIDAVSGIVPGQPAALRLSGHALRHLGMLEAQVTSVSADSLTEERSGQPYFVVRIQPDARSLARLGPDAVGPGMAVEAFVTTATRSPAEFLFDPFTAALRRAFRDR